MTARRSVVLSLGLLLSCEEGGPTPTRDLAIGGGFAARVEAGNRLVISSDDGRVLLDGLAPGTVSGGEPPLVGFAVRDQITTYETQFGAFKPTVTTNDHWHVATTIEGDASSLRLVANGKTLARVALSIAEDHHLVATLEPGDGPERRISWGFACDDQDHFAGFGAQTWDADHRGQTVPTFVTEEGVGKADNDDYAGLWQLQGQRHSSQIPIPQYLARRGYVLTAETDTRAIFAMCSESETQARIEVDLPARIHVFDGPTPREALGRATATFGRPRMPPLVAFAPWIDAVFGSANVRRVAQKLRDNDIPVSVVWTEDWRGGEWSGETYALKEEWTVDETLYPDFEVLADDLHALGYDFHVYFNPFIYEGSKAFAETQPNGWLVKREDGSDYLFEGAKLSTTGLIDLDNPDARAWAASKMKAVMDLGADGWMQDFGEWLPTDGVTAAGPSYEAHNRYPVQWQQIARDAIDGMSDGHERLFFARSGWFGTPELADVIWAGDQRTTMDVDDGMPTIIPIGIGLGVVGISTYGHDIAGYQSANNAGSTKEVFFRWTTLGAWSPVMRTHHGAQPDKEWSWEKDAETIAHFKRYAALHMSLVPLFAGLAREATETGIPIWRGLAITNPDDAAGWAVTDEIMIGDSILLAPIQTPGATAREVYLPAGDWYPWVSGANESGPKIAGGVTTSAPAAVTEIPVFARAGAIVPRFPDGVMTLVRGSAQVPDASSVGDDRVIDVFLGADGGFNERNGLSYVLASNPGDGGSLTLAFTEDGGAEVALTACGAPIAAPCFEAAGDVVHLVGPGVLGVDEGGTKSALTIAGGAAARAIVVRLHR